MTTIRYAAQRVAGVVAPGLFRFLQPIEAMRLRRVDLSVRIDPPPVFIVGAPRTGSTFLYQAVTNAFEVAYLSNLAALMHRSLYLGLRLHSRLYGRRPHGCFRSRYGRTIGLASPSETGKFWHRFFPKERDCVDTADVEPEPLRVLRATVAALSEDLGVGIVFKNLNNGQRLRVLQHVFPEALVIFVRRDPFATACSLLVGRKQLRGTPDAWLSVRPCDIDELRSLPWPDQIARQVHSIEVRIAGDIARFPRRQVLDVHYEDLCADVLAAIGMVGRFLDVNGCLPRLRHRAQPPQLRVGTPAVSAEEASHLRVALSRLDWSLIDRPAGASDSMTSSLDAVVRLPDHHSDVS